MKRLRVRNIIAPITLALLSVIFLGCPTEPAAQEDYSSVSTILGRGYDVFDAYANPEYIKSEALDFDALENEGLIEKTSIERTEYTTVSGSSAASYQEDFGITASLEGEYKFFSGSLGSSFSSETISNSSNQYATIQVRVRKSMYTVKNRTNAAVLKNYLTAAFKEALNNPDSNIVELFKNYGTHVMTGVVMGARYDYNLAASESSSSSSTDISAYAQASFASTFGSAAAGSSYTSSEEVLSAFTSNETSVTAVGGNSVVAASPDGLSEWVNSVADDTVVFSDYTANGLVPIWDLCDETLDTAAERIAAIKAAYETWEDTKYNAYITETDPTPTTGKLRFTLTKFKNFDVMDGLTGGSAEWLWQVKLYSALDGKTHTLVSRIDKDNSCTVNQGDEHSFNYYTTYYDVPLDQSTTFRISPLLEEEDGNDLGTGKNDLFCVDDDGPKYYFKANADGSVTFDHIFKQNGAKGYFSTTSGQLSNDTLTLRDGEEDMIYLVLQQIGNDSGEKVEFQMKIEWDYND